MAANELIELFCELIVSRLAIISKQRFVSNKDVSFDVCISEWWCRMVYVDFAGNALLTLKKGYRVWYLLALDALRFQSYWLYETFSWRNMGRILFLQLQICDLMLVWIDWYVFLIPNVVLICLWNEFSPPFVESSYACLYLESLMFFFFHESVCSLLRSSLSIHPQAK